MTLDLSTDIAELRGQVGHGLDQDALEKQESNQLKEQEEGRKELEFTTQENLFDPIKKSSEVERDRMDLLVRLFRVIASQNDFSRKFDSIETEICDLTENRSEILIKQDKAISAEDYENAEIYEMRLSEIDSLITIKKKEKFDLTREIEELDSSGVELIENERRLLEVSERRIRSVIKELRDVKENYESSEKNRFKNEKGFLNDEKEQISITKSHIEVNLTNIVQERDALEKGISKQTINYQDDLKSSEMKRDELAIRIDE
jgi:hypothetical protein